MLKILDAPIKMDITVIKTEYKDYIVLVKRIDDETGYIYAYSDWESVGELTELQFEHHKKGIELRKVRNLDSVTPSAFIEGTAII